MRRGEGGAELDRVTPNITLDVSGEGEERLNRVLDGLREFNPELSADGLVRAIFLYGLERVELELAASRKLREEGMDGGPPRLEVVKH